MVIPLTEIMFFAGLIATYIVLRRAAMADAARSAFAGICRAFNTFVLICSSVTIVFGALLRRTRPGWPSFDGADVRTGSVFLGVKAYEYNEKFKHGIYPAKPHSRIYEKPDLYYIQGVRLSRSRAATHVAKQESCSKRASR